MHRLIQTAGLITVALLVGCSDSDNGSSNTEAESRPYNPTDLTAEKQLVVAHSNSPDGIYIVNIQLDNSPSAQTLETFTGTVNKEQWKGVIQIIAEEGSDKWAIIQCQTEADFLRGEYSLNNNGNITVSALGDAEIIFEQNKQFAVSGVSAFGSGDDTHFIFEGVKIAEKPTLTEAEKNKQEDGWLVSFEFPNSLLTINALSNGSSTLTEPISKPVSCYEEFGESEVDYAQGQVIAEESARYFSAQSRDENLDLIYLKYTTLREKDDWNTQTQAFDSLENAAEFYIYHEALRVDISAQALVEDDSTAVIEGISAQLDETPLTMELDVQKTVGDITKNLSATFVLPLR